MYCMLPRSRLLNFARLFLRFFGGVLTPQKALLVTALVSSLAFVSFHHRAEQSSTDVLCSATLSCGKL